MMRCFKQEGSSIPKRNPNYDPAEYQKHKDYPEPIMWGLFEGDRPLEEYKILSSRHQDKPTLIAL